MECGMFYDWDINFVLNIFVFGYECFGGGIFVFQVWEDVNKNIIKFLDSIGKVKLGRRLILNSFMVDWVSKYVLL